VPVASSAALLDIAARILVAAGVPDDEAASVARCLVFADRRGIETHGLIRLKPYVERLDAGGVAKPARITFVQDSGATALIDGGNGLGAVVGEHAMELAIARAETFGVGLVVARNFNHFGAAGYYSLIAADRGMVGVTMTNVVASMAPTGALTPLIGNNPVAFAFPGNARPPIVWDVATSQSSWGALFVAAQAGRQLPAGAFLGPDGAVTQDPDVVLNGGSLVPIAGYKGYGLALCIALLTGLLADSRFDSEIEHPYRDATAPGENSATMLAIDVERFLPADDYVRRIEEITNLIHAQPAAAGVERILVPGEREADLEQTRLREGVPVDPSTWAEILELADRLGVEHDLDAPNTDEESR
jgi:LDH2 family malate/lactate/ureidoglycolate dehydrogenase